ncbi:helix-turn-helix transcriptional regulator [uncultured Sphingomonas sp.]|uniref:helix-turn-helix transcriptional regulator n=1 Tax=uncultured Sphingomonas sp. TaxID=158754 RepID=UPI0035CCA9A4
MTVQIVEISGQKMAILPVADYDRLIDIAEEKADAMAALAAEQRRQDGEEYLPSEMVDRLLAGENALKVWREYRGLSQTELGTAAGTGKMTISSIERGRSAGSAHVWRAIANELRVSIDDIMQGS